MAQSAQKEKTLLSDRIPRDTEGLQKGATVDVILF